jgi:hypothetical protein
MGEKGRFWFSRTFLLIVGSIAVLLIVAYGWGFQTVLSWKLRQEAKSLPVLALTPQPLPGVKPNSAVGTKLSDAGFAFEVPWDDLDTPRTKYVGQIAVYAFRSGRAVSFYPPSRTHEDLLSTAERSFGDQRGTLRQLFGPETVRTNYIFQKTMLELTPARMKPWMDRQEAARTSFLLLIKGVSSVGGETGIFNIEANGWKGFQFDDPTNRPKKITLELYDSQDRHIEIIFGPGKTADAAIFQADINRVIWTLVPVDTDSFNLDNSGKMGKAGR